MPRAMQHDVKRGDGRPHGLRDRDLAFASQLERNRFAHCGIQLIDASGKAFAALALEPRIFG